MNMRDFFIIEFDINHDEACKESEQGQDEEFVNINSFDMLSQSYDALFDKYTEVCRAYNERNQEYDKLNSALKNACKHNKELILQIIGKDNLISLLQKDNQRLRAENAELKGIFKTSKNKRVEKNE